VVENWNSANSFIFFGKNGRLPVTRWPSRNLHPQPTPAANLHGVRQYLMIQEVLSDPKWLKRMRPEDSVR